MMDTQTQVVVNQTIRDLCNLIQTYAKSDSVDTHQYLPSLVEALAKLIHLH